MFPPARRQGVRGGHARRCGLHRHQLDRVHAARKSGSRVRGHGRAVRREPDGHRRRLGDERGDRLVVAADPHGGAGRNPPQYHPARAQKDADFEHRYFQLLADPPAGLYDLLRDGQPHARNGRIADPLSDRLHHRRQDGARDPEDVQPQGRRIRPRDLRRLCADRHPRQCGHRAHSRPESNQPQSGGRHQ